MKLPKLLYARIEKPNAGPAYIVADRELYALFGGVGETLAVGVYKLVETKVAASVVEVRKRKAAP
jgi:hypothetical protein